MLRSNRLLSCFLFIFIAVQNSGCRNTYYNVWEKLGWAKRDILVSRVKDARNDQEAAKEQFKTTLQRFREVTKFEGGALETTYNKLNSEYERCQSCAADVSNRIKSVDQVAGDLFSEWKKELSEYQNAELRRTSEQKLNETRARYTQMLNAMRRAEERMKPVLAAFKDQVLFLKHNLNAQAIASLQTTTAGIETDVAKLIKDMETSIAEANSFISQMK